MLTDFLVEIQQIHKTQLHSCYINHCISRHADY